MCHTLQPDVRHFYLKALGGDLEVEFTKEEGGHYRNIFLTGPARLVFAGEIDTKNF